MRFSALSGVVYALLVASGDAFAVASMPASRARMSAPATTPRLPRSSPGEMIIGVDTIVSKAVAGATQGAVGAVVAAGLSAFTEPIVNRVLVQRISLVESIKQSDVSKAIKFFQTTLPTNFIKFPLFEAVNAVMQVMPISGAKAGALTGLVFTTVTLPVTNYRFCKSMGREINLQALFAAYLPTVIRDIAYGIARNFLRAVLFAANPAMTATATGRSLLLFPIVFGACILSSPGNELRGYSLQPKDKKLPFKEFFKPVNYARSTIVGAIIMGTSLMLGGIVTPPAQAFFEKLWTR